MKGLATHRVTVFESGFTYFTRGEELECRWADVLKVVEILTDEQLKVLKVPGAAIRNLDRRFAVHRNDGEVFSFSVNSVDKMRLFSSLLESAAKTYNLTWERVEI